MVITVTTDIEAALNEQAKKQGVTPEVLAMNALRERFLEPIALEPRDDWEKQLFGAARDCGVSLTNWAVSSEGIYD